ncbi:NAD(P)-binding protein [Thozetella sp. PMI_491]|nr:NAD(P)-binding protein [Thozetella sp. PMI_491]
MSAPAIPKGSLVLVTGATGCVGSGVAKELIKAGYKVRAPVRNAEKGALLSEVLQKQYGADCISTVLVADMVQPGSLDQAVEGCAGIVHVASDASFSADPNLVIPPSVDLATNLLKSAAKTASVKRFVFTSSQAVLPSLTEPGVINGKSWNPNADGIVSYAWAEPHTEDKAAAIYVASKISAERACWEFMEEEKPGFVLNTVIPGLNIGEVLHPELLSSSNQVVHGMLVSHPFAVGFIQTVSPTNFVNIEDNGLLHLAALTVDGCRGERLLALGESFDFNRMVDVLNKLVPENKLPPKEESPKVPVATVETTREVELLKAVGKDGFFGFDESVRLCILGNGN